MKKSVNGENSGKTKEETSFEKVHDSKKESRVKNTAKKIWHFLWKDESIASYAVFVVLAFVILRFVFFPVVLFTTGYSDIAAVVSSSMEHNQLTEHTFYSWLDFHGYNRTEVAEWPYLDGLNVGDVIAVKHVPPDEITVGDVILFYTPRGQVIHRVISIEHRGGVYYYTTKGDANPASNESIEKDIPYQNVKGKLVARIPYLGWPKVIFSRIVPI